MGSVAVILDKDILFKFLHILIPSSWQSLTLSIFLCSWSDQYISTNQRWGLEAEVEGTVLENVSLVQAASAWSRKDLGQVWYPKGLPHTCLPREILWHHCLRYFGSTLTRLEKTKRELEAVPLPDEINYLDFYRGSFVKQFILISRAGILCVNLSSVTLDNSCPFLETVTYELSFWMFLLSFCTLILVSPWNCSDFLC